MNPKSIHSPVCFDSRKSLIGGLVKRQVLLFCLALLASSQALAAPCQTPEGYGFRGCAAIGKKMLVDAPAVVFKETQTYIVATMAFDKKTRRSHLVIGNRLCSIFGARALSSYTTDYYYDRVAHVSPIDASLIKFGTHEDYVDTLTCTL